MAPPTDRPWLPHAGVDLPTAVIAALFLGVCALWPSLPAPTRASTVTAGVVRLVDAERVALPLYRRPDLFALPSSLSFGSAILAANAQRVPLELARPSLALDTAAAPTRQSDFEFRGHDDLGAAELMQDYTAVWPAPAMSVAEAMPRGEFAVSGPKGWLGEGLIAQFRTIPALAASPESWRVKLTVAVSDGIAQHVFIEEGSADAARDRLVVRQLMGMPMASPRRGSVTVVISFTGQVKATPVAPTEE